MTVDVAMQHPWYLRLGKRWVRVGEGGEPEEIIFGRARLAITNAIAPTGTIRWLDCLMKGNTAAGVPASRTLADIETWLNEARAGLATTQGQTLTVGEYLEAYLSDRLGMLRRPAAMALRNILRHSVPHDAPTNDPDSLPITAVCVNSLHAYRACLDARCEAEQADAERQAQILRSGRSMHRQARSVFSHFIRADLERRRGWILPPCVAEFCAAGQWGRLASVEYRPADDTLITATLRCLRSVAPDDPGAYLAVLLSIAGGLRKSEIARIRTSDFVVADGRLVVEVPGQTKNGSIRPRITLTNDWLGSPCVNLVRSELDRMEPDAYWLPGTASERNDTVFRRISIIMRTLGWKSQKAIHEWRAWAGCQVAMRDGLTEASRWLRHSSVDLTARYYGRYLKSRVTVVGAVPPSL